MEKTASEKTKLTNKNKIYYMTTSAVMAALMCILSPLTIPIGPIPISLQILIICLSVWLIGWKGTGIAYLVYLLLGLAGLPVFSGFQGGAAKLLGPTGGYLFGFFFLILATGLPLALVNGKARIPAAVAGMILGTALAYLFGTIWFVLMMQCEIGYALSVCVIPFIPFDITKIAISAGLGITVRRPLIKAGLIRS